jgi:hypothetical protein
MDVRQRPHREWSKLALNQTDLHEALTVRALLVANLEPS